MAEILPHHDRADTDALPIVFPELLSIPAPQRASGDWQLFAHKSDPSRAVVAACGSRLVFDRATPWQTTIAHYFLSHVMRLQTGIFFFHGATVSIGDNGVLLSGSKGAGKSTLSLALAARGHGFLGDEIACIDRNSGLVLPFPRAVSIRHGPQAQAVLAYLTTNRVDSEILPDGSSRMRTPVSKMFPAAAARQVPLTHAFFMNPLAQVPSVEPIAFSLEHLPLLAPLHATVTAIAPGERTIGLLRLFSRIRCYMLAPGGTPDQTAELIENIVESKWDTASNRKPNVLAPFAG